MRKILSTTVAVAFFSLTTLNDSLFAQTTTIPTTGKSESITDFTTALAKEGEAHPNPYEIHSDALSRALSHPETLLQFTTSPETAYADRRAAAVQGATHILVTQMPIVLKDRDEMREQGWTTGWGLKPNPLDQVRHFYLNDDPVTLNVLGHIWQSPTKRLPYPITWDEESRAPWPWQAEQALEDLFNRMIPSIYRGGEESCRRWIDVTLTMPCANDAEAARFIEATQAVGNFKTSAVMARWRQIAGDPSMPTSTSQLAMHLGESVAQLGNDERAQGLVQLVFLALMKQPGPKDNLLLNVDLHSMRTQLRGTPNRLPVPATTVLEYCKLAVDPASADDYSRLYCFVLPVCRTIDDPPVTFRRNLDPKSPEVQEDLKLFSDWFKTNRPYWEAAAKAEAPALERLRAESDRAARSLEPTTAH
jgi:hypothetical protein